MKQILIHMPQPLSASGYYRALLPYRHCHKELEAEGIKLSIADQVRIGSHYDAVIMRREVDVAYTLHLNQRRRKDGCKIVWDVDDNFWDVPDWSPVKYSREQMEEIDLFHEICDEVWASTEPLAKKCGVKAKVLPNLADLDDWFPDKLGLREAIATGSIAKRSVYTSPIIREDKKEVRILWSGSSTHRRDIELCSSSILEASGKYPFVKFHFYGYCPEPLLAALFPNNLVFHKWTDLDGYWKTLREIKPTIALAPLDNCEFNTSKSGIRWLEGTLAGAAVIASECEAYHDASYCVGSSFARTWKEALSELIESNGFFGKTSHVKTRDHETIANKWCWQAKDQKERWIRAFRTIVM